MLLAEERLNSIETEDKSSGKNLTYIQNHLNIPFPPMFRVAYGWDQLWKSSPEKALWTLIQPPIVRSLGPGLYEIRLSSGLISYLHGWPEYFNRWRLVSWRRWFRCWLLLWSWNQQDLVANCVASLWPDDGPLWMMHELMNEVLVRHKPEISETGEGGNKDLPRDSGRSAFRVPISACPSVSIFKTRLT